MRGISEQNCDVINTLESEVDEETGSIPPSQENSSESEATQSCLTLSNPMHGNPALPSMEFSSKTGVGCHFLLQGLFLTQGLNAGLPHCRQTLYPLSHQGSPKGVMGCESCSVVSDSATPQMAAHQAPLYTGFSRQEYWSGLPFPSPPWTIQSMEFSRPEYWTGQPFPPPGDLPNPGIEPGFPALQVDSLSAEPPGKPKNTRGGSLSLLQVIFVTLELNRGLLHCRQILYQLSYQGSPRIPLLSPQIVHTVYLGQRLASFF